MKRLTTIGIAAFAIACGDGPVSPTPEDISGTWRGTNVTVSLTLHLRQSGTTVTGQGDFTDGATFGSLSLREGSANSVDVNMHFSSADGPTFFDGRIETGSRMVGTLFFPANRRYTNFVLTR